MAGFDPGVRITRQLIADNPDAALEHIHTLVEQSQQSAGMIAGLQGRLDEAEGSRHELERRTEEQAAAERGAAELAGENESLKSRLADSNAQRSSLLTGQDEALAAYRDMVLKAEPALPPALISGGTLHELNTSIQAARDVVAHVQGQIQSSNASSRMPAGAPMRTTGPDPAAMTRTEKILYGIRAARGEEMTG